MEEQKKKIWVNRILYHCSEVRLPAPVFSRMSDMAQLYNRSINRQGELLILYALKYLFDENGKYILCRETASLPIIAPLKNEKIYLNLNKKITYPALLKYNERYGGSLSNSIADLILLSLTHLFTDDLKPCKPIPISLSEFSDPNNCEAGFGNEDKTKEPIIYIGSF